MKIAVTGAAGMLGTAIIDYLHKTYEVFATDLMQGIIFSGIHWNQIDLLNKIATSDWLRSCKPDVVIHCAAMVNVDLCEKSPELADALHRGTTQTIVETITEWNGRLIYISTDSVFDGKKIELYTESDQVNPLNVYAQTKQKGETCVLGFSGGVVLRTNIFGWSRTEMTSFAEWVVKGLVTGTRLTMFTDVMYTPIHVSHLAECIERVILKESCGLFHATGSSVLSKFDFAWQVAGIFGLSKDIIVPVSVDESNLAARRPKNMALENTKLQSVLGWKIPEVESGILLLKQQYDSGWLSTIKCRPVASGYRFWEK